MGKHSGHPSHPPRQKQASILSSCPTLYSDRYHHSTLERLANPNSDACTVKHGSQSANLNRRVFEDTFGGCSSEILVTGGQNFSNSGQSR